MAITNTDGKKLPPCDMARDCTKSITHTDGSFVYCAEHAQQRSGWKRCRKLKPAEIRHMLGD